VEYFAIVMGKENERSTLVRLSERFDFPVCGIRMLFETKIFGIAEKNDMLWRD
jgi:hypothetical protein